MSILIFLALLIGFYVIATICNKWFEQIRRNQESNLDSIQLAMKGSEAKFKNALQCAEARLEARLRSIENIVEELNKFDYQRNPVQIGPTTVYGVVPPESLTEMSQGTIEDDIAYYSTVMDGTSFVSPKYGFKGEEDDK